LFSLLCTYRGAGGEVGRSMQAVHDAHDDSENFLELLNSRTLAPELFAEPPACDYLKKMEYGSSHGSGSGGGWPDHQFTTAALEKHLSYGGGALAHHHAAAGGGPERLTANLSDLVSNWSIAPPNPCLGHAHAAVAALGHGAKAGLFLDSGGGVCKHEIGGHGAMLEEAASGGSGTGGGGQEFLRPAGYSSMLGLSSNRMYMDVPWGNNAGAARSLSDLISFGGAPLGKPEQPAPATSTKAQAEYKKQGHEISSPVRSTVDDGCKLWFLFLLATQYNVMLSGQRMEPALIHLSISSGKDKQRRWQQGKLGGEEEEIRGAARVGRERQEVQK